MAHMLVRRSPSPSARDVLKTKPDGPRTSAAHPSPFVLSLRDAIPTPRTPSQNPMPGLQGAAPGILSSNQCPRVSEMGVHDSEFVPPCGSVPSKTERMCPQEPAEGSTAAEREPRVQRRRNEPRANAEMSLRSHLCELNDVSDGQVFLLRKIQQLGFQSQDLIRAHFSQYGGVAAVHVAHSHVMSSCRRFVRRMRPSNLAIVVMATKEAVMAIQSAGRDQVVDGVPVFVEPFERRPAQFCDEHVVEVQNGKCGDTCRDNSAKRGRSLAALNFSERKATIGSNVSTGDSDNAVSVISESDDECHISSDFEYYATDDGF